MTPIVAVGNQKGGVGKTSTTLGLASAVRAAGRRVLILDLDPQGNATEVLNPQLSDAAGTYGLLADPKRGGGVSLADAITPTGWTNVDLAPASDALADVDADTGASQPLRLRKALAADPQTLTRYDVVLLDCPPSLGRLLIAGLVAADWLLIVTEPGAHALRGVTRIEETASEVRDGFEQTNPRMLGIIVNRSKRTAEHAYRDAELRTAYGDLVLPGAIPERIAVADAAGRGLAIHDVAGEGSRATAAVLDDLWAELARRLSLPSRPATNDAASRSAS